MQYFILELLPLELIAQPVVLLSINKRTLSMVSTKEGVKDCWSVLNTGSTADTVEGYTYSLVALVGFSARKEWTTPM